MNTIVSLQNELRDFEASLNFLSGLVYWLRTKRIALYHIRAPLFFVRGTIARFDNIMRDLDAYLPSFY